MSKIYIVEGWFGSDEWTEKCFADEVAAEDYVAKLILTRTSERYPDRNTNFCKFAVEEYEVY